MEVTGLLGKLIIGGNVFRIYTFVLIEKIYPLNTCFNIFIFISLSLQQKYIAATQIGCDHGKSIRQGVLPSVSPMYHCLHIVVGTQKLVFLGKG